MMYNTLKKKFLPLWQIFLFTVFKKNTVEKENKMATRIIGATDKMMNLFSRYGRERNNLFSELKQAGINHIRERKLSDNSRVILGYKNESSSRADYAFKVNPNLTMEQKTIKNRVALLPFQNLIKTITRVFTDNKGNMTKFEEKMVKYINNSIIYKSSTVKNGENKIKIIQTDEFGNNIKPLSKKLNNDNSKIIKSVEFQQDGNYYGFAEGTDGSKRFVKNIDGVEYSFTTNYS